MNENDRKLRREMADRLRLLRELREKVADIRFLFEPKLREQPLTTWSPVWGDLSRREVCGYKDINLNGEYFVEVLQRGQYMPQTPEVSRGHYDLIICANARDSDLIGSSLIVFGDIEGIGYVEYSLPPTSVILSLPIREARNLLARINYLESMLKLIGLLPDEEVDSEEV